MESISDKTVWCLLQTDLAWRTWETETVVYVGAEASTHLLTPTASFVFGCLLESGAAACDSIASDLESFDKDVAWDGEGGDLRSAILSVLLEFQRIGLVAPNLH